MLSEVDVDLVFDSIVLILVLMEDALGAPFYKAFKFGGLVS